MGKKGFSILELVISIVIVTTLVGFIVPNVVDYFRQARVTTLQYQLRTMRAALAKYADSHHGVRPRSLYRLVEEGYLAELPVDPFAGHGDSWEVAIKTQDGIKYMVIDDARTRPFYSYDILTRMVSPPYYDPPPGEPATTPGAIKELFWSNLGVADIRSGAKVFYEIDDLTHPAKNSLYEKIDPVGYDWNRDNGYMLGSPRSSYYD